MILTRRNFLLGAASALAVMQLPPFAGRLTSIPALHAFKSREIFDVTIVGCAKQSVPVFFTFHVPRQNDLLTFGINLYGGCLRWAAMPEQGIRLLENDVLRIEARADRELGEGEVGELSYFCRDTVDEGPPVEWFEKHYFPPVKPPEGMSLNPDDSLLARIQREEDRKRVRWSDPAEFCQNCERQLTMDEAISTHFLHPSPQVLCFDCEYRDYEQG